jgi:hypothetical protein
MYFDVNYQVNLLILIKILEGNFWKEILRKNWGKKEISGYGEEHFFGSGNTGFVDSVSGFVDSVSGFVD